MDVYRRSSLTLCENEEYRERSSSFLEPTCVSASCWLTRFHKFPSLCQGLAQIVAKKQGLSRFFHGSASLLLSKAKKWCLSFTLSSAKCHATSSAQGNWAGQWLSFWHNISPAWWGSLKKQDSQPVGIKRRVAIYLQHCNIYRIDRVWNCLDFKFDPVSLFKSRLSRLDTVINIPSIQRPFRLIGLLLDADRWRL